ncbi:MAG: hypothetical protein ACYC3H_01600 [Bellilinea sp.]
MTEMNSLMQLAKEDPDVAFIMETFNLVDKLYNESLVAMGITADQKEETKSSNEIVILADSILSKNTLNRGGKVNVW